MRSIYSHFYPFYQLFLKIFISSFCIVGCTFNTTNTDKISIQRVDHLGDTCSLWPHFIFRLSQPCINNSVTIILNPDPGPIYYSSISANRDSLYFTCIQPLQGDCDYSFQLKDTLKSGNGTLLLPDESRFSFHTYAAEHEPNNSTILSDTLQTTCFGTIETSDDRDYFLILDQFSYKDTILLSSLSSRIGFRITSLDGTLISENVGNDSKKLFISEKQEAMHLYICIVPLNPGTDMRYQLTYKQHMK